MDKLMNTDVRIDIINILDAVLLIAKHRIGEISDEQYKSQIESLESMLKNSQKIIAKTALDELLNIFKSSDGEDES